MNLDMDMSGLVTRLEKCSVAVAGQGKRKALRAGGRVVERAMYLRAPYLTEKQAGSNSLEPYALRDNMRTLVTEDAGELVALAGPSAKVAHVARFVEYGHAGPKGKGDDTQAHPFLRPAYEESITEAVEAERVSLAETIEEQVR